MHEISVLAQVAADFARVPVVYNRVAGQDLQKVPRTVRRVLVPPIRMLRSGYSRDIVIGAVKQGMIDRQFEYAETWVDGVYQVTVWRASDSNDQQTHIDKRLDIALLGALSMVVGP